MSKFSGRVLSVLTLAAIASFVAVRAANVPAGVGAFRDNPAWTVATDAGGTVTTTRYGESLGGDLAAIFNVPAPAGFLVKTVAQGSTAWNMGLQGGNRTITIGGKQVAVRGDIILAVDGIPVVSEDNIERIRNRLAVAPRGAPFKMSVLRAGKVIELTGMSP